ncbi:putative integral membrane protein [marine actinobacterium PHSC20C1]|nr:putative integral membrane protein [marine actinobacterium PHSC20C1]
MTSKISSTASGVGRVLIAIYAVMALGATARSVFQIATKFSEAPLAYVLSALAGLVYIVATVALVRSGRRWFRVALVAIAFELVGVVTIGTLSVVDAVLFPADTVWSSFGAGYLFVPLALPILGLLWLYRVRSSQENR